MNTESSTQPSIETSLASIDERLSKIETRRESKFKITDAFTAVTIALSVSLALYSWSKDRELVRKEQAQLIRSRVATAMGKLDKSKSLVMSIFVDSDLIFEKAKISLHNLEKSGQLNDTNIVAVRNETFRDLLQMQNKIVHSMNDLQMDTAYIDISGYKSVRDKYRNAIQDLRRNESDAFSEIQSFTQMRILQINPKESFDSAEFWNFLSGKSEEQKRKTTDIIDKVVNNVNLELEQIINSQDDVLLKTAA